MPNAPRIHRPQIAATLRERGEVTPLELFFDLVFVLALTQCTALMAHEPTWEGIAKGLLVLSVLWWAWVGYSWLTSAVDPEEGAVRIVIFAAMAALLVISLCVPQVFEDLGLVFAGAYAIVRAAHIALFRLASVDDPNLRASTNSLAVSTVVGVALLVVASQLDGLAQGGLWVLAILIDMAGAYVASTEGWRLIPEHFAERHGLIIIIALGESIVAIGVGAEETLTFGIAAAAVIGIALAATLWWSYFDVVALVAARRLAKATPGKEQNEIARDSFSYIHFPMVAGIVLLALGLKKTIGHVDEPLEVETATAMLGGLAIYLLAHVAFRWRNVHRFSTQRLVVALIAVALIPLAVEIDSIFTLALATVLMVAMILYEFWRFRDFRDKLRHQAVPEASAPGDAGLRRPAGGRPAASGREREQPGLGVAGDRLLLRDLHGGLGDEQLQVRVLLLRDAAQLPEAHQAATIRGPGLVDRNGLCVVGGDEGDLDEPVRDASFVARRQESDDEELSVLHGDEVDLHVRLRLSSALRARGESQRQCRKGDDQQGTLHAAVTLSPAQRIFLPLFSTFREASL